jgi:hypothetical protein
MTHRLTTSGASCPVARRERSIGSRFRTFASVDDDDLARRRERWGQALRTKSNSELFASVEHELGNSGWVQLKGYYLLALRDELKRRGLSDSDAGQAIDHRVIQIIPED